MDRLPTFEGRLAEEDSERLMTYLTVPYLSIPLVLGLFNRENMGALLDKRLQCLLEWVLFETGPFTQNKAAAGTIKQVPVPYGEHNTKMATKWGRLMHELLLAPVPILIAMRKLLADVVYICAEEYTSSYVPLLTWLSRTAARVASFAQHKDQELSSMLRAGAAERNPKKAILVVNATGSAKKMDEPIFIVNGKEIDVEPRFGFHFLLVDAQTLEVLPNGYQHFDPVGEKSAGLMGDWLEKIENGDIKLALAEETKHVFVLMAVVFDGAGPGGLDRNVSAVLRRVLGSTIGKDELEENALEARAGHVLISKLEPATDNTKSRVEKKLLERRGQSFLSVTKKKELRFAVGDEVECNMGMKNDGSINYQKGKITTVFPQAQIGQPHYMIDLDNGQKGITAPQDQDVTIRAAGATLTKGSKGGKGGGLAGSGKVAVHVECTANRDDGIELAKEIEMKKNASAGQLDELTGREMELQKLLDTIASTVLPRLTMWQKAANEANDLTVAVRFAAHRAMLSAAVLRGQIARVARDEEAAKEADEQLLAQGKEPKDEAVRIKEKEDIWDRAADAVTDYMSSVTFVVAWNNDEAPLDGLDEDIKRRGLGDGAGVATLPLHQVFLTHMDVCAWVVAWARHASEIRRGELLSLLPRVAFEKSAGASQSGDATTGSDVASNERWELVRREPPMAQLVTNKAHTSHPYASAAETQEVHRIAGADALELYFDRRTSTEEQHDFVRVYARDDFMQLALEHSGGTTALWPGTSGVPPLVIPGESFGVTFRSDASDTSWGWAITAKARVPDKLVEKLAKALEDRGRTVMPTDHVLEAALASEMLDLDRSVALLMCDVRGPKFERDHQQVYTPGYYQKGEGGVRINLQCAEVYLCTTAGGTRMQMPAPPLVAQNADFCHVFKNAQKYVVEVGRTTRCQELEVSHEGVVYRIAAWKPLSPSLAGGAAVVSYAQKPLTTYHKAVRVEAGLREELKDRPDRGALIDRLGPRLYALIECTLHEQNGDEDAARERLMRMLDDRGERLAAEKPGPLDPDEDLGTRATHVPGEEPEAVAALMELAAWGMPMLYGAAQLRFQGRLYVRYVEGTLGWMSDLIDQAMPDSIRGLGHNVTFPKIYVAHDTQRMMRKKEDDEPGRLLMYLPPQGAEEKLRRGNPGNWYEMVVFGPQRPTGREALEVFELVPLGRSLQRRQVFASDARFALGSMPQDAEPREEPWGRGLRHNAGLMFEGVCHNGKPIVPGGASSWDVAIGSLVIYRKRSAESLVWRDIAVEMDGATITEKEEGWGASAMSEEDSVAPLSRQESGVPANNDPRTNYFEQYLPPWVLRGLLPEALLDEYDFWRVGETTLRGYSKKHGAGHMTSLHVRLTEATYCDRQASLLETENVSLTKGPVPALGPFELKSIAVDPLDFKAVATETGLGSYSMEQGAAIGILSPKTEVTLTDDRQHANINADAKSFAFVYPANNQDRAHGRTSPALSRSATPRTIARHAYTQDVSNLKKLGGFVYFDQTGRVCQVSCLTMGPGLHFAREMLSARGKNTVRTSLQASGRLQAATLDSLLACGVKRFCWVGPCEQMEGIDEEQAKKLWPHGAFVYCYADEDSEYDCLFRVLGPGERPDEATAVSESKRLRDQYARQRTVSKESSGHAMPLGERVKQIELHNGVFAVVRRITRERKGAQSINHVETLINVHAAPRDTCIGRLADVLTRMENLSHILAWAQGDARPGETTAVTKVEMPRMQLRFVASYGQLASLDHDGCFVSDSAVMTSAALKEQLRILDTSLVLENRQREVFILTPSYGLMRPYIQACPMSTALIMDRSHDGWRKHVKATHHKLQLHASGSFLMTQSLSAAMYVLAVRLFKREYALAARLLSSVLSDVPFVNEESWIKNLYARMQDDPHPDAIAMRLRLALQCNDCNELPPFGGGDESAVESVEEWEALQQHRADHMRREFDKYIYKWPSVSAACRLTIEQEWQLAKMLNHQKRKKFLERLRKCEAKPKHGHHLTHYHVAILEPKVGGKLFIDLASSVGDTPDAIRQLQGADLLESSSQGGGGAQGDEPGFRYKRPDSVRANGFEALRAVESVYSEKLKSDASYGWLFLYDLMTGTIGLSFTSQEDSVKQVYPEATTFGVAQAPTPDAMIDGGASSHWGALPDGKSAFQSWAEQQGGWSDRVSRVLENHDPIQAGPDAKGGSAKLTAVPKLLFQMLYLAMITQTTKLEYSAEGPMWKIFVILSHAYDQMMDQIERDNPDNVASDIDMRAKQAQEEAHRAAEAAAEAKAAQAAKDARPQTFRLTIGDNNKFGFDYKTKGKYVIVTKVASGGSVERQGLLLVGDVITHINGEGPFNQNQVQVKLDKSKPDADVTIEPRDKAAAANVDDDFVPAPEGFATLPQNTTADRQASFGVDEYNDMDDDGEPEQVTTTSWWGMVSSAGADSIEIASIEVEKKGDLAQKAMKLLPRFPYHENQYHCTHRGLLLNDAQGSGFVAGLAMVCEWFAYGDAAPPLENRADFRYLAGDSMPAPQRENLESVFLKPAHVRLFNLCMPDITDFAQSMRELNDEKFELSGASMQGTAGLMLDEEQVRAFASRPLDHVHVLTKHDAATGEVHEVPHTISDFVQCNKLVKTFTKAHEGQEAVWRDGKLSLLQDLEDDAPRQAFEGVRGKIVAVEEAHDGKVTLSPAMGDLKVVDNPHSVTLAPVDMLPYSEDVKCVEVEQILEGGVHAKLPIQDVFFRRGAANTFNARKIVERLQHDLGSSAENMSVGFVASMKLLDSAAMMLLRKQTSDLKVTDENAVEKITGTKHFPEMLTQLQQLLTLLEVERKLDTQNVVDGTSKLVELANSSSIKSKGARERLQFQLKRLGGQRAPLHFEFIAAAMLSSKCSADLQRLNPLLDHNAASHELPKACASILLNTIRLCQTNRAIVHANSLQKDIGTLLKQQLRTQVAADTRWFQSPISVGIIAGVAEQIRRPTEELLSWSMKRAGDDPVKALEYVREQLAPAEPKLDGEWKQPQNFATVVVDLTDELLGLATSLERDGHDEKGCIMKLSGLVRLAMHLSKYDADEAKFLLENASWALMAIDLCGRGCQVPMLKQDQLKGVPLRPPTLSGLGSDTSCARFAPPVNAKATQQTLVAVPEESEGALVLRTGVNLMGAMLHAMLHTSLTLAAELTARRNYMQPKFIEQPWSDSEDAALKTWVRNRKYASGRVQAWPFDEKVWAKAVAGRDGKASRDRWENELDPDLQTNPELRAAAARKKQPTKWIYDPRFLVFEFLLGFMLRRRQFELVTEFANAAMEGRSSVNQVRQLTSSRRPLGRPFSATLLGPCRACSPRDWSIETALCR